MSVSILVGDVREQLAGLPADSFDCVVTSPPYWGLRDYRVAGQIGLEPTLGEHLAVMIEVFRAVRRVMKPEGTLWLNYGDCYATTPNGRSAAATNATGRDDRVFRDKPFSTIGGTLKAKDLCMVPNRLAIALQDDGWWVRSEIIWGKTNPMPDSSGRYRPSTAHEKIFLLTKSARSFYDSEAVRVEAVSTGDFKKPDGWDTGPGAHGSVHRLGREKGKPSDKTRGLTPRHTNHVNHTRLDDTPRGEGRLLRNYERADLDVWEMATQPFKGAHFATFPVHLADRCIRAGCPQGGRILDPFGGTGTVAIAAHRLGRAATLIELNPDSAEIARARLVAEATGSPIEKARAKASYLPPAAETPLFAQGLPHDA